MNTMQLLFSQPWAERLGWTLLHFLWQGALISALFAIVRSLLGRSLSADTRYLLACITLGALVAAPLLTFGLVGSLAPQPASQLSGGLLSQASSVNAARDASWYSSVDAWQRTLPWLVMAWLSGVIVFTARLTGGWIGAVRLRSAGSRPAPREWQAALDRLIGRIGVSRPVRFLVSSLVETPTVIGWLRPVILMPVGALSGLPPQHVEALLAHELAHIWRRDYLVNLLQSVAEAVLFYHPAVWWVSNQIRSERESCCDDVAVAACGDVLTYARALAELESYRPAHIQSALAANGGRLMNRISRLLQPPQPAPHNLPGPGTAWLLSVLLLAGIGSVIVRGAQNTRPAAAAASPQEDATIDRAKIWVDTARQGDVPLAVRGLGVLTTNTTVELKMAESQIQQVQPGQPVSLGLRTGAKFAGKVTGIRPGVTNGTVTVDIQVEGPLPQGTQPGTEVDGTIQIGNLINIVYVGRPVFGQADAEGTLFKLEPDGKQAVRTKVQFGRASVNVIQIRSGLQPGDKVILSDTRAFDAFDRINVR